MCRDHSLRQSVSSCNCERSFSISNYTVKHNKIKGEQKYFVHLGGMLMVSWIWVVFALIAGAAIGVFLVALMAAAQKGSGGNHD